MTSHNRRRVRVPSWSCERKASTGQDLLRHTCICSRQQQCTQGNERHGLLGTVDKDFMPPSTLGSFGPKAAARLAIGSLAALALAQPINGHEHHMIDPPSGEWKYSDDPVDGILVSHIFLMVLSYGLIFPIGTFAGLVAMNC